jgi:hypothetical protein
MHQDAFFATYVYACSLEASNTSVWIYLSQICVVALSDRQYP